MQNRVIMQVLHSLEYMSMPAIMFIEGIIQRSETWPPFLRRRSSTATAEPTTANKNCQSAQSVLSSISHRQNSQLRVEFARSTTLLALASITSSVSTLTVTTVTTVATVAATATS